MENLKGKTAEDVFVAAVQAYSDKHNHAFGSFCDLGELPDFIERLRHALNIEPPPKGEWMTDEVAVAAERGLDIDLFVEWGQ